LNSITPLILTYNEAPNIGETLDRLSWAPRIVVVDSFSSDDTVEIAEQFSNVEVIQREFDDHTTQWNFGLQQITSDWVLALDADYRCSPEFADELRHVSDDSDAYLAKFAYRIAGRTLRGTLYPPRAVLFRPDRCRYVQDGHTQILAHDPQRTRTLATRIVHDDRKSLSRWLASQTKYVELEVDKLLKAERSQLKWHDRLRLRVLWAPFLTWIGCLFRKGLILDGWPGCYYSLQRTYVELLLALRLLEARLNGVRSTADHNRKVLPAAAEPADNDPEYVR
jgi:glycosyltransferase involved in cell wall biosynthesis